MCAGKLLNNLLSAVPELLAYANTNLVVPFNKDSCRVGPSDWCPHKTPSALSHFTAGLSCSGRLHAA